MKIKAIYPGTFDPITAGHEDLVKRASNIFESVIVAVASNTQKNTLFSYDERYDMCRKVLSKYKNVDVIKLDKLTVEHAKELEAKVMLRGLRAVSDFEHEFQLATMNRALAPDIESIFLTPKDTLIYVSSSLVKEIASLGGDISNFVHENVEMALKAKLNH